MLRSYLVTFHFLHTASQFSHLGKEKKQSNSECGMGPVHKNSRISLRKELTPNYCRSTFQYPDFPLSGNFLVILDRMFILATVSLN